MDPTPVPAAAVAGLAVAAAAGDEQEVGGLLHRQMLEHFVRPVLAFEARRVGAASAEIAQMLRMLTMDTALIAKYKFSGSTLISHYLTVFADAQSPPGPGPGAGPGAGAGAGADTEARVTAATLRGVYVQLAQADGQLLAHPPSQHGDLVAALAWMLYKSPKKTCKHCFHYLFSMLTKELFIRRLVPNPGQFEKLVNEATGATQVSKTKSRILSVVSHEVHKCGSTSCALEAGSSRHNLNVCGYSDIDVFVKCSAAVTPAQRRELAGAIKLGLEAEFVDEKFEMEFGENATKFTWSHGNSCDLVFQKTEWGRKINLPPATDSEFLNRSDRQRAVRAFKILSKTVTTTLRCLFRYLGILFHNIPVFLSVCNRMIQFFRNSVGRSWQIL
jgi:hypothetical protein